MRFSTIAAVLSTAVLAQAQAPSGTDWSCIKTQPEYTALMPKCAQKCHALALTTDRCDPDDFICHCKNFSKVAGIIEPCVFGPDPGPYGACTEAEIRTFAGTAGEFCKYWNATADAALEVAKKSCGGACKGATTVKVFATVTATPSGKP